MKCQCGFEKFRALTRIFSYGIEVTAICLKCRKRYMGMIEGQEFIDAEDLLNEGEKINDLQA